MKCINRNLSHVVFESIFRCDAVYFLNGVRRNVQTRGLTVVDHQQLVILLIGCKKQKRIKPIFGLKVDHPRPKKKKKSDNKGESK